ALCLGVQEFRRHRRVRRRHPRNAGPHAAGQAAQIGAPHRHTIAGVTTLTDPDDLIWMRRALALARTVMYTTTPNPRVGCVIVRDGRVLGEGATQPPGGPHAEICALRDAA